MDEIYSDLTAKIKTLASDRAPHRTLVGIAGPPGSGKTTIATNVLALLNTNPTSGTPLPAVAVAMDGFHYTRAQLDAFPDPVEAHKRRGAPWTFDADAVLALVKQLHDSTLVPPQQRKDILAPSFDHALKDPIVDDISIPAAAPIVILEGNYLLLDDGAWKEIGPLLDYRVMVHVTQQDARVRVAKRHVASGIEPTLELGEARFDSNDAINGDLIRTKVVPCDAVVESVSA
jgi:pantothenate kinase